MATSNAYAEFLATPLWPAGHLPLKGGDYSRLLIHSTCEAGSEAKATERLIFPFEGQMAGRLEGGRREREAATQNCRPYHRKPHS